MQNNYCKLPASELKPIIINFYTDEELIKVRDNLPKPIQDVIQDGDTLPRMPKRQGGQKRKLLTD